MEAVPEVTHESSGLDRMPPLLKIRTERGLSREVLAAEAGLSPRTIYAIEVEGVEPHRATRQVLARALDCEPDDLR